MPYLHGTYAELSGSVSRSAVQVAGLPVYIGRLPVHLTGNVSGKVNMPLLLRNMSEAVAKVGYCDKWQDYDLCEAIYAHFDNAIAPVGPIVVINVFDPATMREATAANVQVPLIGGRGLIADPDCILDTCAITGKVLGTDFTVAWDWQRGAVVLRDLTGTLANPAAVTYKRTKPGQVTTADVIGTADDQIGVRTGVQAIATVYQEIGAVPTMLCAPGWGHEQAVHAALIGAATNIDGHWSAMVYTDVPLTAGNIGDAIVWKATNNHNTGGEVVCWPRARKGDKTLHISVLSIVGNMQTDATNAGIPYETASNKPADITGYYISSAAQTKYTTTQANLLNAAGIRTVAYFGGRWVLWGPHTSAYAYGEAVDARDVYESNVRMLYYLQNWFQVEYAPEVDKPVSRNRVDTIVNQVRAYLDGLKASGMLLYANVVFDPGAVTYGDMLDGTFRFTQEATTVPPVKALVSEVAYSDAGLATPLA